MCSQLSAKELSVLFLEIYDAPSSKIKSLIQKIQPGLDRKKVLASIPSPREPSHRPLHILYILLTEAPGSWPTFDLIKCHTRLLTYLPEEAKNSVQGDNQWLVAAVDRLVKESYESFGDFLHKDNRPALRCTDAQHFITHQGLEEYVSSFRLPNKKGHFKPRVAIALPNGPLLAATCMAVTTYYTAAPINPAAGLEQFRADIRQSGATFILTTADDYEKLQLQAWASTDDIEVIFVEWDMGDGIILRTPNGQSLQCSTARRDPNKGDDIGLILFTSGTSGTKKVVPLTVHSIVAGIVFVTESWGLSPSDTCLNMMPLYHVGGLVRNVFAPMFSGGSTVCCSAFDPNMFWDVVDELHPTWYYASPSMHSVILGEAANRPQSLKKSRIRLACNAAGGLLPSLACQLRDTFNCVVLPSYGMTECMPISTPPLDYKLDREGTSGISTGPELSILDWSEQKVQCGTVGRICVRGEPVFPGYLRPDGTFDKSSFNEQGWFDTGDLGYMDEDGYLYITGRSKEVINRGGELISPFEVENAILSAAISTGTPISGRVSQVLAFSACHDVLQEVVGVALVTPPNTPRVDLRTLHSALRSSLQQVKWPVLITYMDDVPKKNNKVLRIKLGQRLKLPELTDETPYLERHWEATCPPPDTALQVDIPSSVCGVDFTQVFMCLDQVVPADMRHYYRQGLEKGSTSLFVAPRKSGIPEPRAHLSDDIKNTMSRILHNYMLPDYIHLMPKPFKTDPSGDVDETELHKALDEAKQACLEKLGASTDCQITRAFAEVLSCHTDEIPPNVDFFDLGGDSLKAGRLVSMLRSTFNCPLSINIIFKEGTVKALAAHIDSITNANAGPMANTVVGCTETRSSTNPFLMILQLLPTVVFYPLRRGLQWTVFVVALTYTQNWPTNDSVVGRLLNLTLAISFARILVRAFAPFVGILAKWIIIGRYREGFYPMWGMYHTRWWLTEKILTVCGKGFFSANETTRRIYCRMMGARIGKGVKLAGVSLGEYDLLDIRDGASLTRCVCRPFAAEGNTSMYLGRIVVGENASIGISSIVAAGSVIPPNTCIGPNSSSWELDDADESNRELSPQDGPKPHWLLTTLFTIPLLIVAWFTTLLPWFGGLVGMVIKRPSNGTSSIRKTLAWFTSPDRIGFHYLALVLRCLFSPFILFGIAVLVKVTLDVIFGKLEPGPAHNRGAVATWRAALIKTLLPVPRLHEVTNMFGQHYEATSVAVRMLGGKIGKRVYWPGTGPSIGDYHLLDIGNDVVFGSRSHLITSDATGSETITIRDRAMIADRVVLLPGVEIGEKTTMGSGAMTRRGHSYAPGGTYVGSKGGDAVCLSSGSKVEGEKKPYRRSLRIPSHHPDNSDVTLTEEQRIRHQGSRNEIQHISSVETLAESRKKELQHMSSDDTLAESRRKASKDPYQESTTSFASDSDSENTSKAADASPFGRAFYLGQANYHVLGQFTIFCYSTFMTVFTEFYWNVPNISAIQIADVIISRYLPRGINMWWDIMTLWGMVTVLIAILTTIQAILALAIVIGSKWMLLGRRMPGNYDWDKHPYCQRWQMFLCIEKIRRQCYRGSGVLGMLTGTHWIVLYFKAMGANIGKDCALFANGRPSLMFTEPDLISLGDRVVVDDASVVAHINTRGKFDLNRLEIGNRCVMRTGSRLLSGATMKDDSCLLEHTLIMGGDVVEAKWTMQGWPAERFSGQRVKE